MPQAFGLVLGTGSIEFGSGNFTVKKDPFAPGTYEIMISDCPAHPVPAVTAAYMAGDSIATVVHTDIGSFIVNTFAGGTAQEINAFSFIACW